MTPHCHNVCRGSLVIIFAGRCARTTPDEASSMRDLAWLRTTFGQLRDLASAPAA